MSKVAITCSVNKSSSLFDRRFGRAVWFCLFDDDAGTIEFIKNENSEDMQETGVRAAEKLAGLEVKKIISGDFGTKAMRVLNKLNIQMVILQNDSLSVQEIINKLDRK